jgi:hypothetical protein
MKDFTACSCLVFSCVTPLFALHARVAFLQPDPAVAPFLKSVGVFVLNILYAADDCSFIWMMMSDLVFSVNQSFTKL